MKNLQSPHKLKQQFTSNDSFSLKLKKYALLTTGVLTLGVKHGKAAIIYTDVDPDIVATDTNSADPAFQIDVDGGGNDFGIGFYEYYYYYYGNLNSYQYGQVRTLKSDFKFSVVANSAIAPQSPGTTIGPALAYGNATNNNPAFYEAYQSDGFTFDTEQFMAFKMDASGGGTLYGWARVVLSATGFTLLDYAYESTPDVTINAGEMPVLPIELVTFEVQAIDDRAVLSWATASEIDNQGFAIERSENGKRWEDIGFVSGHGTTNEQHEYNFRDDDLLSGNFYYRLRQMDMDRTFAYSPVRNINLTADLEEVKLNVYPNPAFQQTVQVSFNLSTNSDYELLLLNANGQLIRKMEQVGIKGENQTQMNIASLSAGVYFIRMQQGDGEMAIKRLIIQ